MMRQQVKLGIEVFLDKHIEKVRGKRVGLLTNQTGTNSQLVSTIRLLNNHPSVNLTALFAPEHGLKTAAKEGERFSDMVHEEIGLPVFSLYGASKKPTPEMLELVDIVIFDIQDIGARYYTYIYSLAYMMQACALQDKRVIVLDRPNPIGGLEVEGNLIEEDFTSFVGLYPIPNRHGMTVGEIACYFNSVCSNQCELTVIEMEGWKREYYFTDTALPWIPPSPNTTGLDMMLLYPGTCLIEGTNLSEGRGTTQPFEIVGAPFINGTQLQDEINRLSLPGLKARALEFKPTYQKFAGEVCDGIQLHITDRENFKSYQSFLKVLEVILRMYPEEVKFLEYGSLKHPMFDLLAGNSKLRIELQRGDITSYMTEVKRDTKQFIEQRQTYLLYR